MLTLYPSDWKRISQAKREAAGWRCEGSPRYPECRAENAKPHPVTGSRVVLTVAHLDHDPTNCADENLRAWCQRCHVTDAGMHFERMDDGDWFLSGRRASASGCPA